MGVSSAGENVGAHVSEGRWFESIIPNQTFIMAISPNQLNSSFLDEVKDFEIKLDSQLARKRIAQGGSVSIDVPFGLTDNHLDILKSRYMAAGWKDVKMHYDQREGSWLEFRS